MRYIVRIRSKEWDEMDFGASIFNGIIGEAMHMKMGCGRDWVLTCLDFAQRTLCFQYNIDSYSVDDLQAYIIRYWDKQYYAFLVKDFNKDIVPANERLTGEESGVWIRKVKYKDEPNPTDEYRYPPQGVARPRKFHNPHWGSTEVKYLYDYTPEFLEELSKMERTQRKDLRQLVDSPNSNDPLRLMRKGPDLSLIK
jgi:hypothetical protein